MTFKEQIIATFIGSLLAFIFAIILFLITNRLTAKKARKSYKKLLKREFSYNIELLQKWLNEINDTLGKISADDKNIFKYFKYTYFQVYFLNECFKYGIVYELFKKDKDIAKLNAMLGFFSIGGEQLINNTITSWKTNQIDKKAITTKMQYEKTKIDEYCKYLQECVKDFKW